MTPPRYGALLDFVNLFFPRCCSACDRLLMGFEQGICINCVEELPRLRSHDDPENRVEQLFKGRVRVHAASAFLLFTRGGMVQRMLHGLKYRSDLDVGLALGRLMGEELQKSARFGDADAAIAVPLHRKREHVRGYNQSQVLVDGLRESWPIADGSACLKRVVHTRTQTHKGRWERWGNVDAVFEVDEDGLKELGHVILIDDVVTTGATLGHCVLALQRVPGLRVSMAACAVA